MNIIRKAQIRWVGKDDVVGPMRFIERTFSIASVISHESLHGCQPFASLFATLPLR